MQFRSPGASLHKAVSLPEGYRRPTSSQLSPPFVKRAARAIRSLLSAGSAPSVDLFVTTVTGPTTSDPVGFDAYNPDRSKLGKYCGHSQLAESIRRSARCRPYHLVWRASKIRQSICLADANHWASLLVASRPDHVIHTINKRDRRVRRWSLQNWIGERRLRLSAASGHSRKKDTEG